MIMVLDLFLVVVGELLLARSDHLGQLKSALKCSLKPYLSLTELSVCIHSQ